jgi:membrane-associated phospholipid phosphatase
MHGGFGPDWSEEHNMTAQERDAPCTSDSPSHHRHGGHTAPHDAARVLDWNQQTLEAIQADAASPLFATRALALESLAVFDVLNAIHERPAYLADLKAPHRISTTAAVAAAAYRVLSDLFPAQQAELDAELAESLADVPDGRRETAGVAFGHAVADTVLAQRAQDGWDAVVPYPGGTEPSAWRPTEPDFLPALAPHWGAVMPFALTSGAQFRPSGPPALTSTQYAAALEEVKQLGAATSSERTPEQTEMALFWADGRASYTPPGHWNQIATNLAARLGSSAEGSARMLAELNVALADAGIATWDAKFTYGSWRPITAIRLADTDGNAATTADPDWTPLLTTPNHPEYPSGHAVFSGAAAAVLGEAFGDLTFSATSVTLPGVTREFDSFAEAAAEAGRSRVYGGIHFELSSQDGLALGHAIGAWVSDAFEDRYGTGSGPCHGGAWDLLG